MTFAQVPAAAAVFLDANTLVYHFTRHPTFGPACTQLAKRIERQHLAGFTSTHVLSEIAHRLMTLEALDRFVRHSPLADSEAVKKSG
ncbi:MAG: type II toxin-antitoxin system VapC family toxin [Isosphaeraceae bacterium]